MLALAIIPGIILFVIVWKFDTIEKEPPQLLAKLFVCGALTLITAVLAGFWGGRLLHFLIRDRGSIVFLFINCFILTGLVEEGGKYIVIRLLTWKDRAFNYTFDGVVYAVTASIGFAVAENVMYVIRDGSNPFRVLFSVPGHVLTAVFMGYFYGLSRYEEGVGEPENVRRHTAEAIIFPALMNGLYVICLSTKRPVYIVIFAVLEIFLFVVAARNFIRLSKNDTLIPGMEYTVAEGGSHESKM